MLTLVCDSYASGRVAACSNRISDYQRSFQFYEDNKKRTLLGTLDEHAVSIKNKFPQRHLSYYLNIHLVISLLISIGGVCWKAWRQKNDSDQRVRDHLGRSRCHYQGSNRCLIPRMNFYVNFIPTNYISVIALTRPGAGIPRHKELVHHRRSPSLSTLTTVWYSLIEIAARFPSNSLHVLAFWLILPVANVFAGRTRTSTALTA